MTRYALIGHPLSHSFSRDYFLNKFDSQQIKADYINLDLNKLSQVKSEISGHNIQGFNVTIPYKESILNWLDGVDENAKSVGAVNCIKIENNRWIGYNTDVIGFQQSVEPLLAPKHRSALILGSGGASKSAIHVFESLGISVAIVSRSAPDSLRYEELDGKLAEFDIIVNTTPLGMSPSIDSFPPIPYGQIKPGAVCYDLVYNPEKTQFLAKCEQQGAITKNGLEMLEIQAEESWKIWNS